MKWISVKDKLPEDDTRKLVYNGHSVIIAEYYQYLNHWCDDREMMLCGNITHWMDLTEPPE